MVLWFFHLLDKDCNPIGPISSSDSEGSYTGKVNPHYLNSSEEGKRSRRT